MLRGPAPFHCARPSAGPAATATGLDLHPWMPRRRRDLAPTAQASGRLTPGFSCGGLSVVGIDHLNLQLPHAGSQPDAVSPRRLQPVVR